MYETEIEFLRLHEKDNVQNNRTTLSDSMIESLKKEYNGIPEDFCSYLKEIGSGSFRECQFNIFESIFYLEDLIDFGTEFEAKRYLAFGDNYCGDISTFDSKMNFEVKEFWHDCCEFSTVNKTFKEYIRECMLIDENGNDTRKKS